MPKDRDEWSEEGKGREGVGGVEKNGQSKVKKTEDPWIEKEEDARGKKSAAAP